MKFEYKNWSTRIFDGFYESNLFNSDTEYRINELLQDDDHPQEYEIDFDAYCDAVSDFAVELLKDYCINDDKIIKSMNFKELSSPQYYNFETDKLIIDIDFNFIKLKNFIKNNKNDFNQYLKDNFTSCSGFISFVSNNYYDFMNDLKTDKERCISVMLEYYILICIYERNWNDIKDDNYTNTEYHHKLYENAFEYQINYAVEVI